MALIQSDIIIADGSTLNIESGETMNNIIVNSGCSLFIYSGGIANNTIVDDRGLLNISSGGIANNTSLCYTPYDLVPAFYTVSMNLFSGGIANETDIDYGILTIFRGGVANNTSIHRYAKVDVSSGGTANDITVGNGCILTISSGGTAMKIKENGGQVNVAVGAEVTFVSNTFSGLSVRNGLDITIHSGTTAIDTTMDSNRTCLHVFNGGHVKQTVISDRSSMFISNGGMADNTINNGSMRVFSGGTADNTIVNRLMDIDFGGTANNTMVNGTGQLKVSSGGTANYTTINSGGSFRVINSVTANCTTVNEGGRFYVQSGGTAMDIMENGGFVDVSDGAEVSFATNTFSGLLLSKGKSATVHSGTTATNTTVYQGGMLRVFSGGTATEIMENGGYIEVVDNANISFVSNSFSGLALSNASASLHSGTTATCTIVSNGMLDVFFGGVADDTVVSRGTFNVLSGGTADNTTVNLDGWFHISSGAAANNTIVNAWGCVFVSSGATMTGRMFFEENAIISVDEGGIIGFDISALTAEAGARVNNLAVIQGTPTYTLTISAEQTSGTYALAEGAAEFDCTISVQSASGETFGTVAVGETLKVGYDSYTLNLTDSVLSVTVDVPDLTPTETQGTAEQVSWETSGAEQYIVEYSTDNFEHVISVVTTGNAIDMPDLPAGTYQWRVKADANSDWALGSEIVSEVEPSTPIIVQSNEDGNDDLFFASPNGTWGSIYYAQHVGSINDWAGTNEMISAAGKGRIQNLFFGSADPNVLCLTDEENGDAIFVDDVYTELPEEIEEQTARLYKIQEIRAGAGDDIVDMTSQRFEYVGEGLTIRGGAGNDVIWANKGDNLLFGDAGNDRIVGASGDDVIAGGIGNDRMHGGGGNDVFTFCDNWGADTVEQLAGGSVTLWFASGSIENWDAETLTYTDGANNVTVSGVTEDKVTLKFGTGETPDDAAQFASLAAIGAFLDFTSERVFEETAHIV